MESSTTAKGASRPSRLVTVPADRSDDALLRMVCHRLIAAERVLVLRDGREEEGEDEVGHEDAKVEHLTLANASPKRSCPALSPLLLKDRRVEEEKSAASVTSRFLPKQARCPKEKGALGPAF
jgi:hypothetical protein